MIKYSSYLVCKEHVQEVQEFLGQFFEGEKGPYNHDDWVTFIIPNTNFTVNLMKGSDQPITQHITFEIGCDSLTALETYSEKYNTEIKSFIATETGNPYRYHYCDILGPRDICKIEVNYIETI